MHLTNLPQTPLNTEVFSVLLESRVLSPLAAALHHANGARIPWHDSSFWEAGRILVVPDPEPGSEVHCL